MLRFIGSFFGAIFTMVTMGLLFAALTIGGIFYMYSRDLPSSDSLANYAPPTISRIYSAEGAVMDEFATERRMFVPIGDIPDLVKNAFISAEDKHFYTHAGYDVEGMVAAARDAILSGGRNTRGASTITQQVMKNFLLSGDRSAERKIKEIILAARLEKTLTKDKILELYLNEIFLGQNSYGVAAAAQTYFNKDLADLTPHEAAMLASMPKAPSDFHPVRNKERLLERRNYVLREMFQNGYLDEASYAREKDAPLQSVQAATFQPIATSCRREIISPTKSGGNCRAPLAKTSSSRAACRSAPPKTPRCRHLAAEALREGLEKYDRSQGVWRGTGKVLAVERSGGVARGFGQGCRSAARCGGMACRRGAGTGRRDGNAGHRRRRGRDRHHLARQGCDLGPQAQRRWQLGQKGQGARRSGGRGRYRHGARRHQ